MTPSNPLTDTVDGDADDLALLGRIRSGDHVLNLKRGRAEAAEWTFQKYGDGLDKAPDCELPDPRAVPVDVQLLVDEARITRSTGMLL
jgi:hypothetical protein